MKIYNTNNRIKTNRYNLINFNKRIENYPTIKTLKDIFVSSSNNGLKKITQIEAGMFGTCCKGSIPLKQFKKQFKHSKDYNGIVKKGISTNNEGFAYSFLKTKADNPISTSFVHDCSTIYLYNKQKNTHFLYHMFPKVPKDELNYMIKNFMEEGFTHANIIPGSGWVNEHKKYLPNVFKTLKENNPNAVINVYHNSSFYPEIVGYKGEMFEIMNKDITEQILNHKAVRDYGQASFKISNINSSDTLIKIHYANEEELNNYKNELKNKNYDNEIKKVLFKIIEKKLEEIRIIKSFKTKEELLEYINSKYNQKNFLNKEYHHDFYLNIIDEEIKKFG